MPKVKIIYKITYPTGKIYIGSNTAYNINYFGSSNHELVASDFTWEQQKDFTVRMKILCESEIATNSEVLKLEMMYIRDLHANNPEFGYNRHPKFTKVEIACK